VIDVTKHQGLGSLPGYPFEVRTSASTREQAGGGDGAEYWEPKHLDHLRMIVSWREERR
jgi:hypothetical protein